MPASEARLLANRANALKSTGPKTDEGKARSRRNAYKHGLAGRGVAVPESDARLIDDRLDLLAFQYHPKSPTGMILLQAVAVASVKMDRASRQEAEAIAMHVRHAVADFDEARHAEAEALFVSLGEDPRANLRRLKKSPEGVDRLLEAWGELRDDLTNDPVPIWTAAHLERAGHLAGMGIEQAWRSRLGVLSRAARGDATALGREDGDEAAGREAKAWGLAGLLERIDAEVEALEDHFETLDIETILLDRREAPCRALFDPSKGATLARRYEAAAQRAFYKALDEFRRVEAEFAASTSPPSPPPRPAQAAPETRLASSGNPPSPAVLASSRPGQSPAIGPNPAARAPSEVFPATGRPLHEPR